MTDFSELEALAGKREFEIVNALVLMGWKGTDSAKVQEEPTAEIVIAEDKSFLACTWRAGFSLQSGQYEFHGDGETYTGEEDAFEKYDTATLEGVLEVAVRVLDEMVDIDTEEVATRIVKQLEKDFPE